MSWEKDRIRAGTRSQSSTRTRERGYNGHAPTKAEAEARVFILPVSHIFSFLASVFSEQKLLGFSVVASKLPMQAIGRSVCRFIGRLIGQTTCWPAGPYVSSREQNRKAANAASRKGRMRLGRTSFRWSKIQGP